jgi:hypothetical protein
MSGCDKFLVQIDDEHFGTAGCQAGQDGNNVHTGSA